MRNIRNILSVVCGYAAAVIGAGFASGQEIIGFFVKYGKYSIIGVLLSCIIFSVFAYAVLSVCVEKNIETYSDYLNNFFRHNIRKIVEIITLLFAISTVCVMTACAGEMFFILFGIKKNKSVPRFAYLYFQVFMPISFFTIINFISIQINV